MGTGTATSKPVGPVTTPSGLNVRVVSQTSTTVTIGWDVPVWQEAFVPTIDGSETLTDGKRHLNSSRVQGTVKIGKVRDGQSHQYGVNVLNIGDSGAVAA